MPGIGARQETRASVLRKTAVGTLCSVPVALFVPLAWFTVQLGVAGLAGLGCFIYFNHRRIHPNQERYLKQEATRFAVVPNEPGLPEPQPAPQRLLPKGDQ